MVTQHVARSRGGHQLGMLSGYLGDGYHGDLLRGLDGERALQCH